MTRRRVSKKIFPCGHKGFGTECHRCAEAARFQSLAESGGEYVTDKKQANKKLHKKWTKKELLEESKRLLEGTRTFL